MLSRPLFRILPFHLTARGSSPFGYPWSWNQLQILVTGLSSRAFGPRKLMKNRVTALFFDPVPDSLYGSCGALQAGNIDMSGVLCLSVAAKNHSRFVREHGSLEKFGQ